MDLLYQRKPFPATHLKRTHNESLPPELQWPKWQWYPALFLAFIPAAVDLIGFLFPSLAQGRFQLERFIIFFVLVLIPFLFPTLSWLWRAGCVVRRRVRYYPLLHARTELAMNDLAQMKKGFFDFAYSLNTGYAFDIKKATYYREKLYIVLGRTERHKLSEGDILTPKFCAKIGGYQTLSCTLTIEVECCHRR